MGNVKINSAAGQEFSSVDMTELASDLRLAELEEMNGLDYALAKYKATGVRPTRIAKANASQFGLRHAFWDVYAPVSGPSKGQWILEKDAESGDEYITIKES